MEEKISQKKLLKVEKSVDEPEEASFACMSLDNSATKTVEPSMKSKSPFGSKQSLNSQKADTEKSESSKDKSQK